VHKGDIIIMSQAASERVVNGIKTRVLHGKDYVEVAERTRLIHQDTEAQGFSMIKQERYTWNERFFLSVTIEVKGKQYIGDAEVTFAAPKTTPAGSNPIETAQTSALGRALAFAGYGTVESIASHDEIARHQPGVLVIEAAHAPSVTVEASSMLQEVKAAFLKLFKAEKWEPFKASVLGMPVSDEGLAESELVRLMDKLIEIRSAANAGGGR